MKPTTAIRSASLAAPDLSALRARPFDKPVRLSLRPPVTLTLLLVTGLGLMVSRPMGPWWLSADCDATYVGSALNLLGGHPTEKLDHPGMPLQVLMTLTLGVDRQVKSLVGAIPREAYIDAVFSDMTLSLWAVRGWAIAFFLFGLGVSFETARRGFGHWAFGLMGAFIFLACPGSLTHATTFRPANLLSGLCLIIVGGLTRGHRTPSARGLFWISVLLGWTISLKIHAVGLLPVWLGVAWRARRVDAEEWRWKQLLAPLRTRPLLTVLGGILFASAVILMNRGRPWWEFDPRILAGLTLLAITAFGLHWARSRASFGGIGKGLITPAWPMLVLAVLIGMIVPNAFFLDQVSPMIRVTWWGLSGQSTGGSGVDPWQLPASVLAQWTASSLLPVLPLLLLAIGGTILAVWRRNGAMILAASAVWPMFALAALRGVVHASPHHYGPALVLSVPLILYVLYQFLLKVTGSPACPYSTSSGFTNRTRSVSDGPVRRHGYGAAATGLSKPGSMVNDVFHALNSWMSRRSDDAEKNVHSMRIKGWALALMIGPCLWPIVVYERSARGQADRCAALAELTRELEDRLQPGEVILCDYWAQNADAAYFMQVRDGCFYTPDPPYRSLPDTPPALRHASEHRLTPAYYLTSGATRTTIRRDADGTLRAHGTWGHDWAVRPVDRRDLPGLTLAAYRILPDPDTP